MSPHIIDTLQLGRTGIIAATALETNDGLALFDTGPESTFVNVVAALQQRGVQVKDVRHVFLSHIHFDHAGAAFRFAESGAVIHVHPRGAPHLVDPTRLIESAQRIFGAEMEKLWGRMAPVPPTSIRVMSDGDAIRVGQFAVTAVETPGHASHHHVYHWNDTVFGGDIAGVRLGNGPPIPPFVPPELHIESWLESIAKIRALEPQALYLPHFGRVDGSIADHLDALRERVEQWSDWFRRQIISERPNDDLISAFAEFEHEDLRKGGASEAEIIDYETADPSYMAVPAAVRYWKKYHGNLVPAQGSAE